MTTTLALALGACGGPRYPAKAKAKAPTRVPSKTPEADKSYRPAGMPWWQGQTPVCSTGEMKRRELSWGSVYWCVLPGQAIDRNLQNDLGRLAHCVRALVEVTSSEPDAQALGKFLEAARESGKSPAICRSVRPGTVVRTYHGRQVDVERRVDSQTASESVIRYRFGCEDCVVASETTVTIRPGVGTMVPTPGSIAP